MAVIDILARPMYGVPEAASLLSVPSSTLLWWLEGRRQDGKIYEPILRPEPSGIREVTWGEFVEARWLAAYRRRGVSLQKLRPAVARLRDMFDTDYPLATARPYIAESGRLVVEVQDELHLPSFLRLWYSLTDGQLIQTSEVEKFFEVVEFSEWTASGYVVRLRPAGKRSHVVIDPDCGFGAPTVAGRNIRTDTLADLVEAGDPVEAVAEDFDLPIEVVKQAVAYEFSRVA